MTQVELFIEKRNAPRRLKMPTTPACLTSSCVAVFGEVITRCCGRPVYPSLTPGIPLVVEPPCDRLQPMKGDFDLDAEWWRRKVE